MTPEQIAEYELFKQRKRERNAKTRVYLRNRRKLLKSLSREEQQAYRDGCKAAKKAGQRRPPFPGGRVSTLELL